MKMEMVKQKVVDLDESWNGKTRGLKLSHKRSNSG
jgi:hypothetical protein